MERRIWKGAAYSCAAMMGAAAGGYGAGWCGWLMCAMIWLGCGSGLLVCAHELAAIERRLRRQREAARRSAYRAAFFKEVEKL